MIQLIIFTNSDSLALARFMWRIYIRTHFQHSPLHIYITHKMFESTGPEVNKGVETVGPVYFYSVLLVSLCVW